MKKMPVQSWNQHEVMIGDTMNNNNPHIGFSSPLDKFKNDHLQHINIQHTDNDTSNSGKSSISSLPKLTPQRSPNIFRHWAEPPPAPTRTRKLAEKKAMPIKRRPGSADPRFRRSLAEGLEKTTVTQSDPKIKKNILLKDANTLAPAEYVSQTPVKPVHTTNVQINHVNDWLQSQLGTSAATASNILNSNIDRQAFLMKRLANNENNDPKQITIKKSKKSLHDLREKIDEKKEIIKLNKKQSAQPPDDILDSQDYQETLKLMPNDLVHKYPDSKARSNFGSETSLLSEFTDQLLLTGSAPCLEGSSKMSLRKQKGRLEQVVDYYEKNDNNISPLIEANDSQLNLMCANPEANGLFCKTIPYSLWCPSRHFCLFMLAGVLFSLVGAFISTMIPVQEYINLIHKRYFEEPEESFLDKYVINGLSFDFPKNIFTKIIEKILAVLVMPVGGRH